MVKRVIRAALYVVLLTVLPAHAAERPDDHRQTVTVMTQNLYFGADLGPVLGAPDFPALVAAVGATFAAAQATNIPARLEAVADEIVKVRPDVIGLQEAALWRTGPFTPPLRTEATTVAFDFIDLLLSALAARGLDYDVIAVTSNLDAQVPGFTADGLQEIRLTDRDAILVRSASVGGRLQWSPPDVRTGHFDVNVTLVSPAIGTLTIPRGWASVDFTLRDSTFRFLTAHLETVSAAVQVAQAQELLLGPLDTSLPLIFVCDCNSSANGQGPDATPTYAMLVGAGLGDAWAQARSHAPGFTCCQRADLLNAPSELSERIDLVMVRGEIDVNGARLVGARPGDRTVTAPRVWPSDHAGVAARLELTGFGHRGR